MWTESLERSRERRERNGRPPERPRPVVERPVAIERPPAVEPLLDADLDPRDLSNPDIFELSRQRSITRREAADSFELPARQVSVAAAVLLAGAPVAAMAASGDSGNADTWGTQLTQRIQDLHTPATPAPAKTAKAPDPIPPQPVERTVAELPRPKPVALNAKRPKATQAVRFTAAKRGGGVRELQTALGLPVDGDFGKKTEKALKRWQQAHDLPADGVAGPATRAALKLGSGNVLKRAKKGKRRASRRRAATVRTAGHTRRGGGVKALQRALGLPADGVFGPGTEKALKRWQRSHGLEADGVVGPDTRRALKLGPGPTLTRKHRGKRRRRSGGGSSSSVVQRVISAANRIAGYPYKWGGGHGSFTDSGYDCSGSVSYALHGGGLLSTPMDSGGFMGYGRPGPGRHITIYASAGHVYMTINGRRFDTSARSDSGSRWGGPRSPGGGYVTRHPAGY